MYRTVNKCREAATTASLTIQDVSIGVMTRMLANLSSWLEAGAAHAAAEGTDPAGLLEARLAPDMYPMARQVQMASDTAKGTGARLTGLAAPSFPGTETTVSELVERIAATRAYLEGLDSLSFEGAEERVVTMSPGGRTMSFTGRTYVMEFGLPNFFFHVTTAYAILRAGGVPLGKVAYLSGIGPAAGAPAANNHSEAASVSYG